MIDSGPKRKRKLVRAAFVAWTVAASLAALLPALVGVPTEFMETDKLVGTNNTSDDEFGISVAVDGDTAVVGAFLDDPLSFRNAGSVYVFRYDGLAWPQEARLIA
ncbi:MAG: FG-GAP repeat protein, partial [Myxococcota bacterium]